jgi:hypothetical protein
VAAVLVEVVALMVLEPVVVLVVRPETLDKVLNLEVVHN